MSNPDPPFDRLVSLACHDLRTPLATVYGFATTLTRLEDVSDKGKRYLELIAAASTELTELLEELSLAARVEGGRYEPALQETDTRELATAAAERLEGKANVSGWGAIAKVDPEATERSLYALARCALRHGALEEVRLAVDGQEIRIEPIVEEAAPIVLGDDLRDLGAAVAVRAVRGGGGSVELDGETLRVSLPD